MILKCQLQQIHDVKVYIPDTPQPSSLALITPSCSQVWTLHKHVYIHLRLMMVILKQYLTVKTSTISIRTTLNTYFHQQPDIQSVTIFWDTEEEDDEDVVRMLKTLPHWDWSAPTYFRLNPTAVYNKVSSSLRKSTVLFRKLWLYKSQLF